MTADRLREALVAAFRPHVEERLARLSIPMDAQLEAAIEEGASWLERELSGLLATPFAEQRRGPLEVFQEAVEPATRVLLGRGAEPVPRDPVTVNALPGDPFDLAPASSSSLGEEVWQAHLAWGAEKAAAFRRRSR